MKAIKEINGVLIREIEPADSQALKKIIQDSLQEYGVAGEGTAFADASLDYLADDFKKERSVYYVLEMEGQVIGGSGVQPLAGGDREICELQKMYISKDHRGKKLGRELLELCLEFAKKSAYRQCYLETFSSLREAVMMYEKYGFRVIPGPIGNTGHFSCDHFMLIDL